MLGAALFDSAGSEETRTRWLSFRRQRQRDRGRDEVITTGFAGFLITSSVALRGPILLGYGAHDGLGQFEAVDDGG